MSRSAWHRVVVVFSLVVVMAAAFAAQAVAGTNTTFSGRATVVKGKVAGIPITLVDTGPVAAEGGELEETLLCYPGAGCAIDVPDLTSGMLAAEVLHAAVVAQGNKSHAEASVAAFQLVNVAGNDISAEFLQAEAEARCADG